MKAALTIVVAALLCNVAVAQERVTADARPEDATTQQDFESRVSKYVALRDKLAGSNKPTDSAQEAKARQEQLAAKVRARRAGARQGEIFTPKIAELFKRELHATLRGESGRRIRASLAHAEPVPELGLHVNDVYPEHVPLQSTPPTLLLNLPRLPKGVEYRFVGRNLILYDSATNLIVDYLHDALPEI